MKLNTILGILVIILLILPAFIMNRPAYTKWGVPTYKLKFEKERWLQGNKRTRGAMVKYIMKTDTLLDHKKRTLLDLLGPPDIKHDQRLTYQVDLGHSMGFINDPWYYDLVVKLDSSNVVRSVGLTD